MFEGPLMCKGHLYPIQKAQCAIVEYSSRNTHTTKTRWNIYIYIYIYSTILYLPDYCLDLDFIMLEDTNGRNQEMNRNFYTGYKTVDEEKYYC